MFLHCFHYPTSHRWSGTDSFSWSIFLPLQLLTQIFTKDLPLAITCDPEFQSLSSCPTQILQVPYFETQDQSTCCQEKFVLGSLPKLLKTPKREPKAHVILVNMKSKFPHGNELSRITVDIDLLRSGFWVSFKTDKHILLFFKVTGTYNRPSSENQSLFPDYFAFFICSVKCLLVWGCFCSSSLLPKSGNPF